MELGEIEAHSLLTDEQLSTIKNAQIDWSSSLSEIRSQHEKFSYFELKMAKIILQIPNE